MAMFTITLRGTTTEKDQGPVHRLLGHLQADMKQIGWWVHGCSVMKGTDQTEMMGLPFLPETLTVKQIRSRKGEILTAKAALALIDLELRRKNRDMAVRHLKQRYDALRDAERAREVGA